MGIRSGTNVAARQGVEAVVETINSRTKSRIEIERKGGFRLDLREADLPGVQFLNADLSHASFHRSNLTGASLTDTDLSDASLTSADLSGAMFMNVNFTRTRLSLAVLSGATLQDSHLPRGEFASRGPVRRQSPQSQTVRAIFQEGILTDSWLERTNLSGAGFLRADLSGARLMKADLSGAHFLDANLKNANVSGVQFSIGGPQTAKGLTQAQLDQARADPDNPPNLTGVFDAESGEPLVWRGKRLGGDP